jgi:hypothetical protein
MKTLYTLFLTMTTAVCLGQVWTTSFEDYNLPVDSFLNGSHASGGFSDQGGLFFPNDYNPMWSSWSGWAISSMTDTATRGFMNEFSCISGSGHDDSRTYATSYAPNPVRLSFSKQRNDATFQGLYINNSTYAYHSMEEGDAFAKRFGGADGTDPDFFKLTVYAYVEDELKEDSVEFFLADYRFDNPEEDYIIKEWTYLDLSSLGAVDSLEFTLSSSDLGSFGMNTPAYFCVDDIAFEFSPLSASNLVPVPFEVFPNPAIEKVIIPESGRLQLITIGGKAILTQDVMAGQAVDISNIPQGTYHLVVNQTWKRYIAQLIKI